MALSQGPMRECLVRAAEKSAAAVGAAEQQALQSIERWDEDQKFVRAAARKLASSATAYRSYRSAQCGLVASLGGGAIGNALEIRRLTCYIELDLQRVADLQPVLRLPARGPANK